MPRVKLQTYEASGQKRVSDFATLAFNGLLLLQQNLQPSGQTHPSNTIGCSSIGTDKIFKDRPEIGIANKLESL